MMNSCKVFVINAALSKEDVSYAAKPKTQLRAVPYGVTKKQLVRSVGSIGQDLFSVYDTATSLPADITGMALFLTIFNSSGDVLQVKGKVNSDIKSMVSFAVQVLDVGFYTYDVVVKAANEYEQSLLSGSYVVR